MTKQNNKFNRILSRTAEWISNGLHNHNNTVGHQNGRREYKNKVNAEADKLLKDFNRIKLVFDLYLLKVVNKSNGLFVSRKMLETAIEEIKNHLYTISRIKAENKQLTTLEQSLTMKEIYYFSDQSEDDLFRNRPSVSKFFGLALWFYFISWQIKRYWYTSLFIKKIRMISSKFNHNLSLGADQNNNIEPNYFNNTSNVFSINKNAKLSPKQDSANIFMFDTFVELLVMQVYSRMSVDKMLCKEDIKQIKKHMLKNEALYNGFNMDFSRFALKQNPYKPNKEDYNVTDAQINNSLKDFTKEAEELRDSIAKDYPGKNVSVKITNKSNINDLPKYDPTKIEDDVWTPIKPTTHNLNVEQEVDSFLEGAAPSDKATRNLAYAWAKNNKDKFATKSTSPYANINDSIKKELKETAELCASNHPTEAQKEHAKNEAQRTLDTNVRWAKNDIRKYLAELKRYNEYPVVEFTQSNDYAELVKIRSDLAKLLFTVRQKGLPDFNPKKD